MMNHPQLVGQWNGCRGIIWCGKLTGFVCAAGILAHCTHRALFPLCPHAFHGKKSEVKNMTMKTLRKIKKLQLRRKNGFRRLGCQDYWSRLGHGLRQHQKKTHNRGRGSQHIQILDDSGWREFFSCAALLASTSRRNERRENFPGERGNWPASMEAKWVCNSETRWCSTVVMWVSRIR